MIVQQRGYQLDILDNKILSFANIFIYICKIVEKHVNTLCTYYFNVIVVEYMGSKNENMYSYPNFEIFLNCRLPRFVWLIL